jgi:hypothetical protein
LLGEDHKNIETFSTLTVVLVSKLSLQKRTDIFFTNTSICLAGMGDRKGAYKVLVGIPERKRPLGRPRHK